jgi:hypothetical protein
VDLNFSTLSFCCIIAIRSPLISFTQLWNQEHSFQGTSTYHQYSKVPIIQDKN